MFQKPLSIISEQSRESSYLTLSNQNLTPSSKAQNARGGGRYCNIQSIELSQYFKFVLLYLSFVIFFLLSSKSAHAETFNSNSFHKITTTSVNHTGQKTNEQHHLVLNKNSYIDTINTNIPIEQQTNGNTIDGLYALKFSSDENFTLEMLYTGTDGADNKNWGVYDWDEYELTPGLIEYTLDKGDTWNEWNGEKLNGTATQPIYLRGTDNTQISGCEYDDSQTCPWYFDFTGKYCTGNIENLLDYKTVMRDEHPEIGNYCFAHLFNECINLENAPELPTTKLAECCYLYMFFGCTNLKEPPQLPATTLTHQGYFGMFDGCTSLTTCPELPAMTLADSCYQWMFDGCTNIIKAPKLPATTLIYDCYYCMFEDCTSLKIIPELPATKMDSTCCENMFKGCKAIKLSAIQTEECKYPYRIPESDIGTSHDSLTDMFANTGGTFTGTPDINTTYYINYEPINSLNAIYVDNGLWINKDSEITITAHPKVNDTQYIEDSGYRYKKTYMFDKWSDGDTNTTKILTINQMNALTALGKEGTPADEQYLLTIKKVGYGINEVTVTVDGIVISPTIGLGSLSYWIDKGKIVNISATYKNGYKADSGTGPCTMDQTKTVNVTAKQA